jgi:hypothetical protein
VDTLTHAELMGAGQSPVGEAYDPEQDFMRQRFAENASRRLG